MLQHLIPSGASQAQVTCPVTSISWSRGVTVSTLDPESSDRGSIRAGPHALCVFYPSHRMFFFSFPVRCYLLFLPSCRLAASTSQHACRLPASFHRASFFLSSCGAALASAGTGLGRCHLRWNRLYCNSAVTVAILAQGTHWALAAKQAFCPFTSPMLQPMGL